MHNFQFINPKSLTEALQYLNQYGKEAKIIAGGTDLLVQLRNEDDKITGVKYLVYIDSLPKLKRIEIDKDYILIGATVNHVEMASSEQIGAKSNFLSKAASMIGSPQIRNRGTIGGNLVNASPAADMAAPLLTLDAVIQIESIREKRDVKLKDFFLGPGQTVLKENEIVIGIKFKKSDLEKSGTFIKMGQRNAMTIAIASIAVNLEVRQNIIIHIRVAAGSVAPTPIRLNAVEEFLENKEINNKLLEEAMKKVSEEVCCISDIRASAEYRRYVSGILFRHAFKKLT